MLDDCPFEVREENNYIYTCDWSTYRCTYILQPPGITKFEHTFFHLECEQFKYDFFPFLQKTVGAKYRRKFFIALIPSSGSMFVYIDTASAVKSFAFGGGVPVCFRSVMTCYKFCTQLGTKQQRGCSLQSRYVEAIPSRLPY